MEPYIYLNCPPAPYYLESGIVQYQVGDSHPNRANLNVFDLIIVKQGKLSLGEEQEKWEVQAGEGLVLLPNRYHYSVKPVDTETIFYWVHFQTVSHWVESNQTSMLFPIEKHQQCFNPKPYAMKLSKNFILTSPQQTYQLLDQMNHTLQLLEPKSYWQKQQSFEALLYLLDERHVQYHASQLEKLAEKVELYLRNNFKNKISNELLATIFNYHYNYINRAMKAIYHCSPHDYITKLRMEEAKLQLLHSLQPINTIAFDLGYEYAPYFTQCFRKHTGISPSQFRKLYRI